MSETMVTRTCGYSWPVPINSPKNELCPASQQGAPPKTFRHICNGVQVPKSKENDQNAWTDAREKHEHMCAWCNQHP
jgi:hypothetical protein